MVFYEDGFRWTLRHLDLRRIFLCTESLLEHSNAHISKYGLLILSTSPVVCPMLASGDVPLDIVLAAMLLICEKE
jgi:hypothetical protein